MKAPVTGPKKKKIEKTIWNCPDDSGFAHKSQNGIVLPLALPTEFDSRKLLEVSITVLGEVTVAKAKHGPLQKHAPTRMKNVDPVVHLFVSLAEEGGLISGELGCDAGKVHDYQQED